MKRREENKRKKERWKEEKRKQKTEVEMRRKEKEGEERRRKEKRKEERVDEGWKFCSGSPAETHQDRREGEKS